MHGVGSVCARREMGECLRAQLDAAVWQCRAEHSFGKLYNELMPPVQSGTLCLLCKSHSPSLAQPCFAMRALGWRPSALAASPARWTPISFTQAARAPSSSSARGPLRVQTITQLPEGRSQLLVCHAMAKRKVSS